jgi:hypothetical protein
MKLQIRTGVLFVTTLCLGGTCLGAGAPAVPDSLRACARKPDVLQRLSCYDAEMAKLDSPQAAAPAAVTPAAAATTTAAAAAAVTKPAAPPPPTLGSEQLRNGSTAPLGEEQVRKPASSSFKFWKSKDKQADAGMTARIDGLKKTPYGLLVVTLDNGQVWRQLEAEDNFPLDEGETVRIDKGAMGSYRLTPVREGWKRFIRVTRTK